MAGDGHGGQHRRHKTHFSRLVERAEHGEADHDRPRRRAGRVLGNAIEPETRPRRPIGLDRGRIIMHPDFDDPLPELEDHADSPIDPPTTPLNRGEDLVEHARPAVGGRNDERLSRRAREILEDPASDLVFSAADALRDRGEGGEGSSRPPEDAATWLATPATGIRLSPLAISVSPPQRAYACRRSMPIRGTACWWPGPGSRTSRSSPWTRSSRYEVTAIW